MSTVPLPDPVAWRYRFQDWADWAITTDPHREGLKDAIKEPLYLAGAQQAPLLDPKSDPVDLTVRSQVDRTVWRDMADAPLNTQTLVRLLVRFDNHGIEDTEEPTATIGSHNDGVWNFVGWNWYRDEWTRGSGDLLGWLPMVDDAAPEPAEQKASQADSRSNQLPTARVFAEQNNMAVTDEWVRGWDDCRRTAAARLVLAADHHGAPRSNQQGEGRCARALADALEKICVLSAPPHRGEDCSALMMSIWLEADAARAAVEALKSDEGDLGVTLPKP